MASSKADCTFDGALFISSASKKFEKIGQNLVEKSHLA